MGIGIGLGMVMVGLLLLRLKPTHLDTFSSSDASILRRRVGVRKSRSLGILRFEPVVNLRVRVRVRVRVEN